MERIASFFGPFRFLSNFYIEPDGTHVEGEFQQAKTTNLAEILLFTNLNPINAKRLGRLVTLRPGWDSMRDEIMYHLVKQKFEDHESLREKLLATYPAILEEGNHWDDTYWGICDGIGENKLGKILMRVREELRNDTGTAP